MVFIFYLLLFVFGLAIGSFFNVVLWRYRPEFSLLRIAELKGRSHCPYCQCVLHWFELVPLFSFILQRGKCRRCRHPLSWQYPLVELAGGAIFAGVPAFLNYFFRQSDWLFFIGQSPLWYYGIVILWFLIFLSWLLAAAIDFRHFIIPNGLNIFLGVLGAALTALLHFSQGGIWPFHESFLLQYVLVFSPFETGILANHLLGALAGLIFFASVFSLTRGRAMGLGDVKLALAMGLILGWPDIGLAIMLSFIIGGLVGIFLICCRKTTIKGRLPFGPFLVLGALLTVFFGEKIISLYFSIFGIN